MKNLTDDQINKLVDANAQKSVSEITRICLEAMYGISEISDSRKHSIKRHTVCLGKKQTLELLKKSLIWNPPYDTAKPYIKVLTHFLAQLRNARYVGHAYNGPAKTEWRCRLQKAELTRDKQRAQYRSTAYPSQLLPMGEAEFEERLAFHKRYIPMDQLQNYVSQASKQNITIGQRFAYVDLCCEQYMQKIYRLNGL